MEAKRNGIVRYDAELHLEAYLFEGIAQPFPEHVHDYYVIGLIESGVRSLSCRNRKYTVKAGDILLFHPNDGHGCSQKGGGILYYRGLNIPTDTMLSVTERLTGERVLPNFSQNVIVDEETALYVRRFHQMVLTDAAQKEKTLFLLMAILMKRYGQSGGHIVSGHREEVEKACALMEEHCGEHLSLEQVCQCVGWSKSTLLRVFMDAKGVTPYRYLQSVRICRAKALLEKGVSPAEAALRTGFCDQSHFTNFFRMYTGLSPGAYGRVCRESYGDEER